MAVGREAETWLRATKGCVLGVRKRQRSGEQLPWWQGVSTALAFLLLFLSVLNLNLGTAAATTVTFTNTTASGSYTVPAGVNRITIVARAADGGSLTTATSFRSGEGATVNLVINVSPGDIVQFVVGAAGANGDLESGGGGGTGVFVNGTLVMVAGGGGGGDNTGNGGGGQSGTSGSNGGPLPGAIGTGGNGGGGGNNGGTLAPVGDGGGGGGGILSAGGNVASSGGSLTTGGGRADTNTADGLSVSPGGTSNQTTDPSGADGLGTAGGSGFGGGGAGSHRESGAGGGYSGGGGGGSGGRPGGGGSFLNNSVTGFVSGSITAGADGGGTSANGFVRISYVDPTITVRKIANGGTGTFTFSGGNGYGNDSINASTAGSTFTGATRTLTNTATATTITEGVTAGFTLTAISCTGLGPGGAATPDLANRSVLLDAAAIASDAAIVCTFTNTAGTPSLSLVKTGTLNTGPDGVANVGDTITYTFTVRNTGNVTLTNVTVTDPGVTMSGGPIASLAAGVTNSTTFTATRTLTQANINAGVYNNTATVTGTPPAGPNVTAQDNESVTIPAVPSLSLVKTGTLNAGSNGVADAGDTITYTFTVTNTGNVPLTNVTITDPGVTLSGGLIASLAPGASNSTTFTATRTLTQANINAGVYNNTATVIGTPPSGPNVTAQDNESVNLPAAPALTLVKTGTLNAGSNGVADAGDTITYTFTVTNTGNVPLTNVTITDPGVTMSGGPIASLAPGASNSTTFTATRTLTQANINAGVYNNTATVTGTPPSGPNVTAQDSESVSLAATPSLSLVKTGTLNAGSNGVADAGDTISYTFTVTNTGNVTLTNVTITDPGVTITGGPIASLAPGASNSTTFTATRTLTQANINAGTYNNTATVTGTPPSGPNVTGQDTENTPLAGAPALTLVKTGTVNTGPDGVANVGDTITYAFTVTNTGNVTLTNVTITDAGVTMSGGPIASLAPGASNSTTFTATRTLTQANINAGTYNNTATVTGTPPSGPNVTGQDTENTPLAGAPALTLVKTGTLNTGPDGVANPGDTITYAFTVTNTGNVTLTNVTITDPGVTMSGGPIATLAPGASNSTTFTATRTLTQANINAGTYNNTATAIGTPPSGPNVTGQDTENTPLAGAPGISLVKTGTVDTGPDGVADAGDTITYTFAITNTGNVTLTNVTITDPGVTITGGPIASLAPGVTNSTTITATRVITQANINAGTFNNTATVTGTPPSGPNVTDQDTVNTPLAAAPALTVVKSGTLDPGPDGLANAGDVITYAFAVTNSGNVTLTNVRLTDPGVTITGGPIASLAPGITNTTTFTATRVLTQANINAGTYNNTATVTGTPPSGPDVTAQDTETTPINGVPSISLTKVGTLDPGPNGVANAGDVINYTFEVTNTGNVTLTNVTITDPGVTLTGGPIASLAPGATNTTTFTATRTLTQANVNAGTYNNTATVTGTPPSGPNVTAQDTSIVSLTGVPSLTLVKTGTVDPGPDGVANAGDTINYTFEVTNVGNVTLTNVTITDPGVTLTGGPIATLAPGDSDTTTFTATRTLTQANVNAGSYANTATVTGTPPSGPNVTAQDTATVPLAGDPSLTLVKQGTVNPGPDGVANPGDTITYAFTVTNTGNVTLTNVTITDPGVVISGGPIATLAPGVSNTTTFTATRTLTQANINAGVYNNTATVTGTPPSGPNVTAQDTESTPISGAPSLTLVKTGTLNPGPDGIANAGDTITYTFAVTNTGNVTLTNVTLSDPRVVISGGPIASLAPGVTNSTTFTATRTLTQANVNAGVFNNTATVTGTPPSGPDVDAQDTASTPLGAAPSLSVVKVGTLNPGPNGVADAGDVINYTFEVTNTGNVTLTNVKLTDPGVVITGGPIASLAPGATNTATFTATRTLTQANINAGNYTNTATVTGTPPSGPDVTAQDTAIVPLTGTPSLTLVKTGTINPGPDGVVEAGDTITYAFEVTNIGNVTLTDITLTDPGVTISGGPIASLAPGASDATTFTATRTLTQANINSGSYANTATVTGTPPSGPNVTAQDTATVPITAGPALTVVKTGTLNAGPDGVADAGETITYAFTVTNTGNVTLTDVTLTDPGVVISGGPIASLAPGVSNTTTFTATRTLTQANINAGTYNNTATVTGTPPSGPNVTAQDTETTPLGSAPGIEATKTTPSQTAVLGETVTFTIRVRNTGNTTLTSVSVADTLTTVAGGSLSLTSGPTFVSANQGSAAGTLLPAETATYRATFVMTQRAIDGGGISNQATATGTPPSGPPVTDDSDNGIDTDGNTTDDPTVVPVAPRPAITIVKTGTLNTGADGVGSIGDTISYRFRVENTGNVTLANVTISDPTASVSGGPIPSLAPGAVDTTTFTATYVVTQADLNATRHVNTVTVTANPPTGPPVTAQDQETVAIPRLSGIAGTVFFDLDGDGQFGGGDRDAGAGYIVQLIDDQGNVVRSVTTGPDGAYNITAPPGSGYKIVFRYPGGKVAGGIPNVTLPSGQILGDQDFPIDPSGVIYNSQTREPVAGVTVTITTPNGTPLPAACLIDGSQQNQVTGTDGAYRFDIVPGADPRCPAGQTEYRIRVNNPSGFENGFSTQLPPQAGAIDVGTCPGDAIPGGPCQPSASGDPPASGPGTYYVRFVVGSGDPPLINNHIAIDPAGVGDANFTKVANVSTLYRGGRVAYVIQATEVTLASVDIRDIMPAGFTFVRGSARVNGAPIRPVISGRTLLFEDLIPDNGVVRLELVLLSTASAEPGTYVNTAQLLDQRGGIVATARASVEILPEHVFDCGEIIGRVFDDKNRNGYHDEGEPGLPGVRVATVKGLLVLTDKHGRFHVACADIPDGDIGSNFILKLDTRTLPTGYRVTTENPRTVRLTRGKITKLNFGASASRVVRLDIKDHVFVEGTTRLNKKWSQGLDKLMAVLDKEPSILRLVYFVGAEGKATAANRVAALEKLIAAQWQKKKGRYTLPIETRIVGKE
jgi:uncharacterized repeat protein (TIGR01451 family)